MLSIDVSAKLVVTTEAIGVLAALSAVDLGVLGTLVVALVDGKLSLPVGSSSTGFLGKLFLGLGGELDGLGRLQNSLSGLLSTSLQVGSI